MLALLLAGAVATAPSFVVHGDHGVGGVVIGRSTPAAATARFGRAGLTLKQPPDSCTLRWPKLGLRMEFISLGYGPPCAKGVLLVARITGTRFHTERGLRVGDPAAKIARLYPKAHREDDGVWIVTRHACAEVGAFPFASLFARVDRGKVTSIRVRTVPCE